MKLRIYILSVLVVLSMLLTIQVKADNNKKNNNNLNNNGTDNTLPINSGIVFLTVAGIAIGIFAVKKAISASKMTEIKS